MKFNCVGCENLRERFFFQKIYLYAKSLSLKLRFKNHNSEFLYDLFWFHRERFQSLRGYKICSFGQAFAVELNPILKGHPAFKNHSKSHN